MDERARQPVEQLGMGRQGALRTEVLGSRYEATTEEELPEMIDRHARGEWVPRVGEPARQPQAIARRMLRERQERGRGLTGNRPILRRAVGPARADVRL